MKMLGFVLLICCATALCQRQNVPTASPNTNRVIFLKQAKDSHVTEQDLSKLFLKTCPDYSISSSAQKYDFVLATATYDKGGVLSRSTAIYDKGGVLIRSTGARPSTAVKEICDALDSATLIEVVDMNNFTQTSDGRGAPLRSGIAGVADALHGRRNTLTDNASLNIVAHGEHALLDCYEHHKGCTTIAPGKYYGEIDGDSIWIDYEMPITHEAKRNHYVIAGGW
jgi:hypothetical protein